MSLFINVLHNISDWCDFDQTFLLLVYKMFLLVTDRKHMLSLALAPPSGQRVIFFKCLKRENIQDPSEKTPSDNMFDWTDTM